MLSVYMYCIIIALFISLLVVHLTPWSALHFGAYSCYIVSCVVHRGLILQCIIFVPITVVFSKLLSNQTLYPMYDWPILAIFLATYTM